MIRKILQAFAICLAIILFVQANRSIQINHNAKVNFNFHLKTKNFIYHETYDKKSIKNISNDIFYLYVIENYYQNNKKITSRILEKVELRSNMTYIIKKKKNNFYRNFKIYDNNQNYLIYY